MFVEKRSCRYPLLLLAIAVAGCAPAPQDPIPELAEEVVAKLRATAGKGSSGGGAKAQAGDGWGTLTGTIRLAAAPPALTPPTITQDQNYCGPLNIPNETIVTGEDIALGNVVIYLKDDPDKIHDSYVEKEKADIPLDNNKCRFQPHICLLRSTQKLKILNSDPVSHNTKLGSVTQPFNESLAPKGQITKALAAERLPVPVNCNVHPWMQGYLVVKDHPYMQITDAKTGAFRMENLPAGIELEFQVWHERSPGGLTGSANHRVNDRGRFKVTIPKDETIDFQMTVPLSAVRATPG